MSGDFTFTESTADNQTKIVLTGYVNEFAKLPEILNPAATMRIGLKGVTGLNSVGTRNWCDWLRTIKPPTVIILEECPMIFVKAFNQVQGALTPTTQVASFYVPYYSDDTGERKDVLFVSGQHFMTGGVKPPEVKDSAGKPMEMDVIAESYFAFLKRT